MGGEREVNKVIMKRYVHIQHHIQQSTGFLHHLRQGIHQQFKVHTLFGRLCLYTRLAEELSYPATHGLVPSSND